MADDRTDTLPPPDAWIRDQRGEYEGPETLEPLFTLGGSRPVSHYGATYSPLIAVDTVRRLIAEAEERGATKERERWETAAAAAIDALEWHASRCCEDSMPQETVDALDMLRARTGSTT